MATLKEGVQWLRQQGQPPPPGTVGVRGLLQSVGPAPSNSVRAPPSKIFGLVPTTRWGIVIVTQTGIPRRTTLPLAFLDRLFGDGEGVGPYYRQLSGSREVFSWRVFGPFDMYTPEKKAEVAAQGPTFEAAYLRQVAPSKGIPVADFDRFAWVMDSPGGGGGGTVGGGDVFVNAWDLTQHVVAHEMGHAFGINFEGDTYVNGAVEPYGDPFCPMDRGPAARTFQNFRMAYPGDPNTHQTTGPVMCAAHTFVMGFLDFASNVVERAADATDDQIVIDAFQGAPAAGDTRKVALTVGPVTTGDNMVRYWIEYRAPFGFDRSIDRPPSTGIVDIPQGALVMHEMRPNTHVILIGWVPAVAGNSLRVPGTSQLVEIMNVHQALRNVTLRLRLQP